MIDHSFDIDVTNADKNDHIIQIRLGKDESESFEINFNKFYIESQYMRDNYRYEEAASMIESEIRSFASCEGISIECVKHFINLVNSGKGHLPLSEYGGVYLLAEHFCFDSIVAELDGMNAKELCVDVDFTIERLAELNSSEEGKADKCEWKLGEPLEEFLSKHVDECLQNPGFGKIPIASAYRVISGSGADGFDMNLLAGFISESVGQRWELLGLIDLSRLDGQKVEDLLGVIKLQDENTRRMCEEQMRLDVEYELDLKKMNDQLLDEVKQKESDLMNTKNELAETQDALSQNQNELEEVKHELDQSNHSLEDEKQELAKKIDELNQSQSKLKNVKRMLNQKNRRFNTAERKLAQKMDELLQNESELENMKYKLDQTKYALSQSQSELENTKHELNQTKEALSQSQSELENMKHELDQTKEDLSQSQCELERVKQSLDWKKIRDKQMVQVCGYDTCNAHVDKPNNKYGNFKCIYPPMKARFDPSFILSFSAYLSHSVQVTRSGSLLAAGCNDDGSISNSLERCKFTHSYEFRFSERSGEKIDAFSAVCLLKGTLYLVSKGGNKGKQLIFCHESARGDLFIDTGSNEPVGLFGGSNNAAAITNKGLIIFINPNGIKNGDSQILPSQLPGGEKAVMVACCRENVFALSSNGRVFESPVEERSCSLNFKLTVELDGLEIIWLSGVKDHCLAVSSDGRVFGRGSNEFGCLGLGSETHKTSRFVEIKSLTGYNIRAAYAGGAHSLFETHIGQVISCGCNNCGQLFQSFGPSKDCVYTPFETTVKSDAKFCIAGCYFSEIFISVDPPPNTPNRKVSLTRN